MKLVIITQTRENYGAHDWDGNGPVPQYWKNKVGSEYIVDDIEHFVAIDDEFFAKNIQSIVYDFELFRICKRPTINIAFVGRQLNWWNTRVHWNDILALQRK